jgi:hypothetical protein
MKMLPIANFKRRVGKMSDEKLLKLEKTVSHRNVSPEYRTIVHDELVKRKLREPDDQVKAVVIGEDGPIEMTEEELKKQGL